MFRQRAETLPRPLIIQYKILRFGCVAFKDRLEFKLRDSSVLMSGDESVLISSLRSAKLKNNREVCINPETKWLQQYLKNAINK